MNRRHGHGCGVAWRVWLRWYSTISNPGSVAANAVTCRVDCINKERNHTYVISDRLNVDYGIERAKCNICEPGRASAS